MKQAELARRLGISKSYMSMILSGQRTPNSELSQRLSSLGLVNFEGRFCLEGRNSTTELLPHILYLSSAKPAQLLGIPELS